MAHKSWQDKYHDLCGANKYANHRSDKYAFVWA